MKLIRYAAFAAFTMSILGISAEAQRKRPVTSRKPAVITTDATTTSAIKSDAQKVSDQVINVSRFLYLFGGIAKGIEDVDTDPRSNRAALDQNAANKKTLIQSIRNLTAGLAALETDFRTKPALRKYLLKIEGIAGLSGSSEDLVAAGKFKDAYRPLVSVIEKLTDTLVAMP